MFRPEDPLAPPRPAFAEPWHAQSLALVDALVKAGRFTASEWADALGAALRKAESNGEPDTEETYYLAVLAALEELSARRAGISREAQEERKSAWAEAYRRTPHGQPVMLENSARRDWDGRE